MSSTLQGVELSRLKWQSRRGLLENDLVLESFYRCYETELTPPRVAGLNTLLDLGDNDLWDLLSGRSELHAEAAGEAHEVLRLLRGC